jgi:hypothetical protein
MPYLPIFFIIQNLIPCLLSNGNVCYVFNYYVRMDCVVNINLYLIYVINKVNKMSDLQITRVVGYAGRYCCQSSIITVYESSITEPIRLAPTLVRTGALPPNVRHTQNCKRPHPVHHCRQTEAIILALSQSLTYIFERAMMSYYIHVSVT